MSRCCSLARRTAVSLAVLVAGAALTWGQAPEPALNTPANDPKLVWGPCPDILPAGCQIAALHGDPAKPNADVFLKLPAKSSFAKHMHTSAERMILVSGELHVTFDGQKPAVVKAGSYMYGPPGRPHTGACASAEPCLLFIAFEGPVDAKLVN
jgi:mannose-6-phosphate isomerase-like protein (cupin superfamily)